MAESEKFVIRKIFNNNVILAEKASAEGELIFVGKGIGFSHKAGDQVLKSELKIDKEFAPIVGEKRENYIQLLEEVDSKVIGVTEEIIAMVSSELEEDLNQHIRIGLTDHIAFSLKRIKDGIEVANPFLAETRTLYNEEYRLAEKAVEMLSERFELEIPESEIGFITFHIHGARNEKGLSKTLKNTTVIKELVTEVENELGQKLSYESLNYARLVNHLRFALERIETDASNPNPLLENIKENFSFSFEIAEKLAEIIEEKFNSKVPEAEKGYLALHLQRLKRDLKL
ncbi:MAG: transcriptional antiterminator [Halanaerobium sp. 4-GBenrich]|jgi:transcriptional antiterminator|uniref:BglG family transcriptional antiterminator n=1 Tax=Halanaerobium congolense TaxID=54121 RepID=A0A1G6PZT4_9FIRM|nr:transcription antiterminator [Halanaerobium congolense]KXS49601.1 MAG: transcriptional antiterminator [Halanaerobium sp. T82-1]ODS49684.1 MAG: transcriptional antiterminator [Halanaerobium sp. 4-GBenrich]PUU92522.1 MAG: transcriptional antiterminator [Halanaerobium sp.]PTX15498.1 BglG family transcriptional antiterminator [Halanaerobium congolense]PXV68302.1 BglG family transcriptional antiterminator [Halanaerobium congolense]